MSQLSPTAAPGATVPADGDPIAVIQTNHGRIVLRFFPEVAPNHVANFIELAESGYYDGIRFHRVIPGFMIQGGDPHSRDEPRHMHGSGGPGYSIAAEFNEIPHTPGILSAARTSDPNSAGSQFFLMHRTAPHLDRQYSVYGQVIEGMDVVEMIVNLPKDHNDNPLEENPAIMEKVTISTWPLEG
ncbi:MAG: peptidylprolyl isomerase [Armatimonadetes bacterium]|nr:peptidylprolyl isomerase [Armatimonadota bacterium]MBS1711304.1 peptidylprolyl isomerase [Armatimonadota bacterium]MBX3107771.1 peptidylprolyl isomerase [Fimbriimonadaceae bacterium]